MDDRTHRAPDDIGDEKGLAAKGPFVTVTEEQDGRETRPAKRTSWSDAITHVFIAVLPLYFVVYCGVAFLRDGTLANSARNQAILQLAKFNPTIFPIVFTSIVANFIKAFANWKLERGTTVGSIQHLLGSRSLVSSCFTPIKLRTWSLFVPCLVIVWACNPIGGQLSLRAVSKESNITITETAFVYVDPMQGYDIRAIAEDDEPVPLGTVIDVTFQGALLSPPSSKNGTQDMFGNIQIPMLEHIRTGQAADTDGWYRTTDWSPSSGVAAAVADVFELREQFNYTTPIYSAMVGIPFKANLTAANVSNSTASVVEDEYESKLAQIKRDLFGADVLNTMLQFNIETSYMYTNCSFQPLHVVGTFEEQAIFSSVPAGSVRTFPNTTVGIVNNTQGFSLAYDRKHNYNSTKPRRLGVESFVAINGDDGSLGSNGTISEAWCDLTTTYVEAQVSCLTETNCTVSRLRESRIPHNASALTVLDGISFPYSYLEASEFVTREQNLETYRNYSRQLAPRFFRNFARSTGTGQNDISRLSPLESYFGNPESPYKAAYGERGGDGPDQGQHPIVEIGDELMSYRLSQLLNTYWLMTLDPFTQVNGIDFDMIANEDTLALPSTNGRTYIIKLVLRCHPQYMSMLLLISVGLLGMGLGTAYMVTIQKGPDVLDDFVNSLRHNPYVHVDNLGPSMEDGKEMAQRLKHMVVKMGDVKPEDAVGYVAIGTPSDRQPVEHLDYRRHYL